MEATDRVLLERWVATRDADSFAELARRYSGLVYTTCRRVLGDPMAAEDVAQECFEMLARWHAGPADYLGPWLHRVATTRSLNRVKTETRRRDRERRFVRAQRAASEPVWDDLYELVDEAIEGLPELLRRPVVLHFFEGKTHETIAEALGTSRQTVTYRIGKGVEGIRRFLKRRGVAVASPALAGLLSAHLAHGSVPASLGGVLAKLAIAGPVANGTSAWIGGTAAIGGVVAMKKIIVVCGLIVVVAAGLWVGTEIRDDSNSPATVSVPESISVEDNGEAPSARESREEDSTTAEMARENSELDADNAPPENAADTPRIPAQRPQPKGTNTLTGRVVLAGTDEPVADFTVGYSASRAPSLTLIRSSAAASMETVHDTDGRFTLENAFLERGATVLVQAPGFADGTATVEPAAPGAGVDVRVELHHGVRIAGVVVDSANRPVAAAGIYTGMLYVDNGGVPPGLAATGPDGRFTLDNVDAFMVVAYKAGYAPGYVNVDLENGDAVDVRIGLDAGAMVTGRVVEDDMPLPNRQIRVHASLSGTAAIFRSFTDSEGMFQIAGFPAGETNVWAYGELRAADGHPVVMSKSFVAEPGGEYRADFDFTAESTLSGVVFLYDEPAEAQLRVSVETLDGAWQEFQGRAAADGAYRFDALPAGLVTLKAMPAARMSGEGYTAWREQIVVGAHEAVEHDVHIAGGNTLDGRITGVGPGEVCAIEVLQGSADIASIDESTLELMRTLGIAHATGSPEGTFHIEDVQPGAYTVLGIVYRADARNNLERFAGARFTTVEVDLAGNATIELPLESVSESVGES